MDVIFINSDFYLETDIDYAALNLTTTQIVVPMIVVEELKKAKTDKSKKVLADFEKYRKLPYFVFDNEENSKIEDILDFIYEYHCEKKYFASFSMEMLAKNTFDLFFECKEFAQKEVVSDSVAKKFVPIIEKIAKEDNDVAKNILALCYSNGYGLEQNHELAIEWFKKARKANVDIGIRELYIEKLQEEYDSFKKKDKLSRTIVNVLFISVAVCGLFFVVLELILRKGYDWTPDDIKSFLDPLFVSIFFPIVFVAYGVWMYRFIYRPYKKASLLKKEIENLKSVDRYRRAAAEGDKKAQERLKAMEKKKSIDDIVHELNADKIMDEHSRAKRWYKTCLAIMCLLLGGFAYYMYWNVTSIKNGMPWEEILVRILISMSFLSMIFILMNQAARSRKNMVLLSKEIQEYKYIGALLKGKVDMSTNGEETNKEINDALSKMIQLHLDIQKQRLEKEDHSEVKDITPDVLNFFKDNTSTMMGNFNEMQKNILDLHKTIVQTLKDNKGEGK